MVKESMDRTCQLSVALEYVSEASQAEIRAELQHALFVLRGNVLVLRQACCIDDSGEGTQSGRARDLMKSAENVIRQVSIGRPGRPHER